ncbi:MAG: GMP synthase [Porphyromonadaceae bacterium CG2_30_38_12]|nr:MAG: GMP synthase [Porphyromonadaceae bacterium CG2_30_38_12]
MNIHIVQHESFESPASILSWAKQREHAVTYSKMYAYEELPKTLQNIDLLIVLGGPQSPQTTDCPYFNGKKEMEFIRKAIHANKPVLGICLGAQLIGEALGTGVEKSPQREIGVFQLQLTPQAQADLFFKTLPEKSMVGHWHGDMPGLTPEAEVLAYSNGCPRQIIKYSPKVYGFQCHFEFTSQAIEAMIENNLPELEQFKDHVFVENQHQLRNHNYEAMNKLLNGFLDYFITLC